MEVRACVEVRGQLGGRSLTWVFPIVGVGEAPGGLKVFSLACPAKSSVREDFEVNAVRDTLQEPLPSFVDLIFYVDDRTSAST